MDSIETPKRYVRERSLKECYEVEIEKDPSSDCLQSLSDASGKHRQVMIRIIKGRMRGVVVMADANKLTNT